MTPTESVEKLAEAIVTMDVSGYYTTLDKERVAERIEDFLRSHNIDPATMQPMDSQQVYNALSNAHRDIGEWCQFANYLREKSDRPNHDPRCPTEAAIRVSRHVQRELGSAMVLIRNGEQPEFQEPTKEAKCQMTMQPMDSEKDVALPLSLEDAKARRVCRICGNPDRDGRQGWTYNCGQEYAHTACLKPTNPQPAKDVERNIADGDMLDRCERVLRRLKERKQWLNGVPADYRQSLEAMLKYARSLTSLRDDYERVKGENEQLQLKIKALWRAEDLRQQLAESQARVRELEKTSAPSLVRFVTMDSKGVLMNPLHVKALTEGARDGVRCVNIVTAGDSWCVQVHGPIEAVAARLFGQPANAEGAK